MKNNKSLDILKRFRNIESSSFSFSKFANLIYEKLRKLLIQLKHIFQIQLNLKY